MRQIGKPISAFPPEGLYVNTDTIKRYERLLVATKTISEDNLTKAREEPDFPDPALLIGKYCCDTQTIRQILAEIYRTETVDFEAEVFDADMLKKVSPDFCRHFQLVPLREEGGKVVVAMTDPEDLASIDEIRMAVGLPVKPVIALPFEINEFLDSLSTNTSVDSLVHEIIENAPDETGQPPVRVTTESEARKPVVQVVDRIIRDAVMRGAKQVFLIPFPDDQVHVRLGMERKIVEVKPYPMRLHANIVNRLRVLANLVGKDKRQPQSGSFMTMLENRRHRVDLMIVPATSGEAVTMFVDQEDSPVASEEHKAPGCTGCGKQYKPEWKFCPFCGEKVKQ
jgi:type IV pilus assembly protein PilB